MGALFEATMNEYNHHTSLFEDFLLHVIIWHGCLRSINFFAKQNLQVEYLLSKTWKKRVC